MAEPLPLFPYCEVIFTLCRLDFMLGVGMVSLTIQWNDSRVSGGSICSISSLTELCECFSSSSLDCCFSHSAFNNPVTEQLAESA